ncbi:methyltransferase family protein [Lachnoclostridium phytofermentans]|uniref:Isoprenylcysteine carboxyl methyltransferase n=1 Tax=Lachnoclostridium phytofermentans (strain ATCC 700394 / DSM 18823 / ISDg) TaxID=357809 RepID=A9KPQ8_LACP7|nr:isoprenylcysteine carboxylmethyltransferase family protein [Lachnoclostridium phytofermentans]ABX41807.1 Isoprenylcysteine carboxyl methyltransferase [Lachnoclostridium phytofermentans ISDg]
MTRYIAVATLFLLIILVLFRAFQLKKLGIKVIRFGEMDKKDFIIPPFALLLFYIVFASAFGLPKVGAELYKSDYVGWIGVALCALGIILFLYALISFGKSFRVGLDEDHPGELVTTGAFSISRNPIYSAFGLVLIGIFLIIPNWIILIYVLTGIWLFNRQILLEEQSLRKIYGEKYAEYCKRVRRFL